MRFPTVPLFSRAGIVVASVLLLAASSAHAVDYSFQTLQDGNFFVEPYGIGNDGTIVGREVYGSGTYIAVILRNGVYTRYGGPDDKPGDSTYEVRSVTFTSINSAGTCVAQVDEGLIGSPYYETYSHTWNGGFSSAMRTGIYWQAINDAFQVAGYQYDPSTGGSHGFVGLTTFDYPNVNETTVFGLNNNGRFVGWFEDSNFNVYGYYKDLSAQYPEVYPSPPSLFQVDVYPQAINDVNEMVGYFADPSVRTNPVYHGFIYQPAIGYYGINVPGSISTIPRGINNAGVVVGTYTTVSGLVEGFVATPEPYSIDEVVSVLQVVGGLDTFQGYSDPPHLDLDHDGKLTLVDAAMIMRKIGGLDRNP